MKNENFKKLVRSIEEAGAIRREPAGAARVLLEVTATHPKEVFEVVKGLEFSAKAR
jgi:hypothetical protein